MRTAVYVLALAALLIPAAAGQGGASIRANIRGGGGDGKCTFEVVVDGAAEVQIRGDQGSLRTLSGAPARCHRIRTISVLRASTGEAGRSWCEIHGTIVGPRWSGSMTRGAAVKDTRAIFYGAAATAETGDRDPGAADRHGDLEWDLGRGRVAAGRGKTAELSIFAATATDSSYSVMAAICGFEM
jgi:hypothetical protein